MRDGKEHCPFCGEHSAIVKYSGRWGYFVSCKCSAVGPSRRTQEAAIEAWNTRKGPKPDNQLIRRRIGNGYAFCGRERRRKPRQGGQFERNRRNRHDAN